MWDERFGCLFDFFMFYSVFLFIRFSVFATFKSMQILRNIIHVELGSLVHGIKTCLGAGVRYILHIKFIFSNANSTIKSNTFLNET